MKKKIFAFLLAVCLVLCAVPSQRAQAASDVCFISVNDRLLELSSKAECLGGVWYVPCTAFSDFGIYYSYFSTSKTAMLYTSEQQFFFDLRYGVTYDRDNNYYGAPGSLRNGTSYVPVNFVCQQFGLGWSYIAGNGYGDVCRIKDGSAVLPDTQFLSAAADMMRTRYNSYKNISNPDSTATVTQPGTGNTMIYLSFQGLPTDAMLTTLKSQGTGAAFFLSYDDIKHDPDRVRRIVGEGYGIGLLCESYGDYDAASGLLFEAAHIRTLLVGAVSDKADACKSMAEANGLVFCGYAVDGVQGDRGLVSPATVTSAVSTSRALYVRLLCNDATAGNLAYLLRYFANNRCTVRPVNEINHG